MKPTKKQLKTMQSPDLFRPAGRVIMDKASGLIIRYSINGEVERIPVTEPEAPKQFINQNQITLNF